MCGICGIARRDGTAVASSDISQMRLAIKHRGPDDEGEFLDGGLGLGFQRLAILDLTPTGHQPMLSPDRRRAIVFNGEIYNFHQLRSLLEKKGYAFRSKSDTEVLLHGYDAFGEDVVDHLVGMFAFAIWDSETQSLLLGRDRLGKKPLYYTVTEKGLFFASELQALWAVTPQPELQPKALLSYFRWQCIPGPETLFTGVYQLPPAHIAWWKHGKLQLKRYWDIPTDQQETSDEDAVRECDRLLRQAVHERLYSDVPLGVFLSGGLDSSIITAIMAQESSRPVETFSIGFREQSHNELPLAKLVAEKYHTNHHEIVLDDSITDSLPTLLRHSGQPFADSSLVAVAAVAEATKKHVTVALNGDGGDENFAGYEKYSLLGHLARLDAIPRFLRAWGASGARLGERMLPSSLQRKAHVLAALLEEDVADRYLDMSFVFPSRDLPRLWKNSISGDLQVTKKIRTLLTQLPSKTSIQKIVAWLDYHSYLPDTLLIKADIAAMTHSLEARSPFLDHRFVEFTARLPEHFSVRDGQRKWLLRKTFGHLLPTPLLQAQKRGFDLPVNAWFSNALANDILDRLHDQSSTQSLPWINWSYVTQLVNEHRQGKAFHGNRLWSIYCLLVWNKESRA